MENVNIAISVIIPVYNSEKYLEESLQSVLAQSLRNIELICVNDGSTDNSKEIIEKLQKQDYRIMLINKKNEGQGIARNIGMSYAQGKYIAFFDPDDLYKGNNVLKDLYDAAEKNNAMICGGNIECFYEKDKPFVTETYNKYHVMNEGMIKYQDYQNVWAHVKYIFNRNFIEKNKINYPKCRRGEDSVFMINALYIAKEIYMLPETVYLYRHYKKRAKFSPDIIVEMLMGYYRTMCLAIEIDMKEPFVDCMEQLRFWYHYVGFNAWNDEKYWEVVELMNKKVILGTGKWGLKNTSKFIFSRYLVEQNVKMYVETIREIKTIADSTGLVIYGMGEISDKIVDILHNCQVIPNRVVISGEPNKKTFHGIQVEQFRTLSDKTKYSYLICIANQKVKDEVNSNLKKEYCNNIINLDVEELANMEGLSKIVEDYFK